MKIILLFLFFIKIMGLDLTKEKRIKENKSKAYLPQWAEPLMYYFHQENGKI